MDLERLDRRVKATQWIAVGLLVGAAGAYVWRFGWRTDAVFANDTATWGQLGDYMGGLLNPVMAFLAFYWLTQSVRLQKTELEETRKELKSSADAQVRQVELSARAAQISALGTLLSSTNSEIAEIAQTVQILSAGRDANHARVVMKDHEGEMKNLRRRRAELTRLLGEALALLAIDPSKAASDSGEAPPAP